MLKESRIVKFEAPWEIYASTWSPRTNIRIAIGSFIEDFSNYVQILQYNESKNCLEKAVQFSHPYPPTKLMFNPEININSSNELLASSGDVLRLWNLETKMNNDNDEEINKNENFESKNENNLTTNKNLNINQKKTIESNNSKNKSENIKVTKKCELSTSNNSEYCAPLTSFDWNVIDPTIIGTSSIDTTCTIWDVVKQTTKTQLIAHDKEVYDIAFACDRKDYFASVGADGSVRLFDLRSLEHSTIIYESKDLIPLLRIQWNKKDHRYLATFEMDSKKILILDIRVPTIPVAELYAHSAPVNAISWAPHSHSHICSVSDDSQALIWDLSAIPNSQIDEPLLAYSADSEINSLSWPTSHTDWISIGFDNQLQLLHL